ncbi:MAG: PTS sugar transporter subunit IIA [Alphaproteobacteria bacterium]
MDIEDLLDPGAIAQRVSAADKRQALSIVAEIASRQFGLKPSTVLNALLRRETQGSTGVGHGVAIPHARVRGLDRIHGVFVRLEAPVDFGADDQKPVDLLFALLGPPEAEPGHLTALAKISRAFRSAELRTQLRHAGGTDAIRALLFRNTRPTAA